MPRKTRHIAPGRWSPPCVLLALTTCFPAAAEEHEPSLLTPLPDQAFHFWPLRDIDDDEWNCSLCPDTTGWRGDVTAGAGFADSESARFGRYTGLDDDGAYFLGGAGARYLGADGEYFDLDATDLGLDTRSVRIRGGERGRYRAYLNYSRIPGFVADDTRTVFEGVGSRDLRLSSDWEPAPTTGGMTGLGGDLADIHLGKRRDTLNLGVDLFKRRTWEYGVEYKRIEDTGSRIQGGSFITTASLLPLPVDRVTDQVEARVAYLQEDWHAMLSYHGSFFSNRNESITWDNPFTPFAEGGDRGQLSQEPDNRSHQVTLAGVWRPHKRVHTSGRVALGRMEQDESFLAPTINPFVGSVTLPRSDLDGRVDTLTGNLRLSYSAGSRLTLTGEGFYEDRDNRTPRGSFTQVRTDTQLGPIRQNRPYSFERTGARGTVDFRATPDARLSAGASYEEIDRTFQEVETTETSTFWGELRSTPHERVDLTFRLSAEQRRLGDPYTQLDDLDWEENPLLRKFHLGERDRKQLNARVGYQVSERFNVGVSADYAKDDYEASRVGLTDARDQTFAFDVSALARENVSIAAFYVRDRIDSNIASSAGFGPPDWNVGQEDTIDTVGLTLEAHDLGREGFDAGVDFAYSGGRGKISMNTGVEQPALPDLRSRLHSFKVFGRYRMSDRLSVRVDYWYERYRTKDFSVDGVAPDTIPTVLTLGETSPNYSVHFIGTSLNYQF